MVKAFARLIELGKKNFNNVSDTIKEDVRAQIIADGYTINDDGTVTANG